MSLESLPYANGTFRFVNVSGNTLHEVAVDSIGNITGASLLFSPALSPMICKRAYYVDGMTCVTIGSAGKVQESGVDGKVSAMALVWEFILVVLEMREMYKNMTDTATGNGSIVVVKVQPFRVSLLHVIPIPFTPIIIID